MHNPKYHRSHTGWVLPQAKSHGNWYRHPLQIHPTASVPADGHHTHMVPRPRHAVTHRRCGIGYLFGHPQLSPHAPYVECICTEQVISALWPSHRVHSSGDVARVERTSDSLMSRRPRRRPTSRIGNHQTVLASKRPPPRCTCTQYSTLRTCKERKEAVFLCPAETADREAIIASTLSHV